MYIHVYPKILCTPLGYSITKKIWYPYQGLVHVDSKGGVMSAAWILFVYAELYVHVQGFAESLQQSGLAHLFDFQIR